MLNGMKVLSLCHYLQGPAAAQYLADLGADVIKVEPVGGAHERHWAGAKSFIGDVSSFFLCANRNKRSLAVDLKAPEGLDIVRRLAQQSDALLENFRPGVLDRLGLGYDTLRGTNPGLIYASATGFGATGPLKDSPGQDLLVQARCGLIAGTGERFAAPKAVGAAVVDQHGGSLLAMAVVAAYVRKLQTGQGTRVESSLFNAGLDLQAEALAAYINGDVGRERYRRHPSLASWFHEAPYGVYGTKDQRFVVIGLNDPIALAGALGSQALEALAAVDRYDDRDAYAQAVADATVALTYVDLVERLDARALWYAPVQDYEDLKQDPQVRHNRVLQESTVGDLTFTLVNPPVDYDGQKLSTRHFALVPGADTRAILHDLGMRDGDIDALAQRGVVAAPVGQHTAVSEPAEGAHS
ncbi:MAG: CoA transferase [Alcaligenaceae bacterium]|nr:CoA transferase [Alcaligenaceae bacterium]